MIPLKATSRLERLREELTQKETDGVLISQPENRFYLSGFDGSSGFLIITQDRAIIATDFRYLKQAKLQAKNFELHEIKGNLEGWLPEILGELKLKKLGFESGHLTYQLYDKLTKIQAGSSPRPKLAALDGLVESLRAVKEPGEVELISKAAQLSDAALEYIGETFHTGMSEKETAWELERFLRDKGSQTPTFEVIVASGPNAAMPHHKPSERKVRSGEPVIIDFGAKIDGYSSDITRTFCLGKPDERFNRIYDIVLGAQLAAIALITEGMTGEEADRTSRTIIEEAGYAEAFGHGLGHGIGLEVHEEPRLGSNSEIELKNGMVFTIEPGIYLSGWGGVRIEDTAILEDGKVRVISKTRK